jgi:hypothetical protein
MTFGGPRVDSAIARELLRAVEPMAIEAAFKAERMHWEQQEEQQRILDLELRQARYEAGLAERRYAACDPDNRLIAAQLEKNWEAALRRVRDLEERRPTASEPRSKSIRMPLQIWRRTSRRRGMRQASPCGLANNCCGL